MTPVGPQLRHREVHRDGRWEPSPVTTVRHPWCLLLLVTESPSYGKIHLLGNEPGGCASVSCSVCLRPLARCLLRSHVWPGCWEGPPGPPFLEGRLEGASARTGRCPPLSTLGRGAGSGALSIQDTARGSGSNLLEWDPPSDTLRERLASPLYRRATETQRGSQLAEPQAAGVLAWWKPGLWTLGAGLFPCHPSALHTTTWPFGSGPNHVD